LNFITIIGFFWKNYLLCFCSIVQKNFITSYSNVSRVYNTPTSTPTKIVTSTPTTTSVLTGTPYSTNSTSCQNNQGICATYSKVLSDNTSCKVSGYSTTGTIKTSICSGDSKTLCCTHIPHGQKYHP
jgi:hypothetical protein